MRSAFLSWAFGRVATRSYTTVPGGETGYNWEARAGFQGLRRTLLLIAMPNSLSAPRS